MKLYIKQNIFSWRDRFAVYDDHGNDRFYVEGELFSLGKKLHVYDRSGAEVAYIKQELLNWLPKFTLYRNDGTTAQIRREFSFFHPRYAIDGPGWEATGGFWEHDYEITQGSRVIASIHKEWMSWGDSYEIDILDSVDPILALGIVLTIDFCMDTQENCG